MEIKTTTTINPTDNMVLTAYENGKKKYEMGFDDDRIHLSTATGLAEALVKLGTADKVVTATYPKRQILATTERENDEDEDDWDEEWEDEDEDENWDDDEDDWWEDEDEEEDDWI